MRGNWTPYIESRLRRPSPTARLIVEAVIHGATADIRQRKDQWEAADGPPSAADFDFRADGMLALKATNSTVLDNAVSDGTRDSIDGRRAFEANADFYCAKVVWGGTQDDDMEIQDVRIYVDPAVGGGPDAVYYELHLMNGTSLTGDTGSQITLTDICDPKRMIAPQVAGNVTFDFSDRAERPKPKKYAQGQSGGPWTYFVLFVLDSNGSFANYAAIGRNSAAPSLSTSGNVLTLVKLSASAVPISHGRLTEADQAMTPRMRIRTGTYVAKTITFNTDPGNILNLGSAPTGTVQFTGQGLTPGTTSILYEVSDDGGANWQPFVDGDFATDLTGISSQQKYSMRVTLTPGTGGSSTPLLKDLGVSDLTMKSFDNLCTIEGNQGFVDPLTLSSRMPTATIKAIKDGINDYMDAISDVFAQNYIGAVEWRIWVGWPDDPDTAARHQFGNGEPWMLVDTFLTEDYGVVDGSVEVYLISALSLLKQPFPPFDEGTSTRDTYSVSEALVTDTYEDIRDGQLGIPARWCGPGPVDSVALTRISKDVTESDAYDEMCAAVATIGWGQIGTQGKIKAVDFYGSKAVVRFIGREDVKWGICSPGFKERVPEYFVPYDFDQASGIFLREARGFHADALTQLGRSINPPTILDDIVAQWVRSVAVTSLTSAAGVATVTLLNAHGAATGDLMTILGASPDNYNVDAEMTVTGANTFTYPVSGGPASPATGTITCALLPHRIANRVTSFLGPGTMLFPVMLQYPHPELEIGDLVDTETDRFVAKDPTFPTRQLRGLVHIRAVVQRVNDLMGQNLVLWCRSYSAIAPTTVTGTRDGRLDLTKIYNTTDVVANNATPNWSELYICDSEDPDYTDLHDTGSNTERITVSKPGRYAITAHVSYSSLGVGGTAAVSLIGSGSLPTVRHSLAATAPASGVFEINLVMDMKAGDYYYLLAAEGTGPTFITLVGGSGGTTLQVARITGLYPQVNNGRRFGGVQLQ